MTSWFRWLLVVPAALGGWLVALALGLRLIDLLDRLCPKDQMVSGMCVAPWYDPAFEGATYLCVALAAFLVVALATAVAPAQRVLVSWLAFGAGAAFATHAAISTGAFAELCVALVSGIGAVWAANRLLR